MPTPDPYDPDEPLYECRDCHNRVLGEEYTGECPECGGEMVNINKAQE